MKEGDRFVYYPMRKPEQLQPDCPVYVYCYGLAVQRDSGAAFVQVRLVNRSDNPVNSVFLHISGKTISDHVLYELSYVPLVHCKGGAHEDFGEEQVLFLPHGAVHSLDIRIEDVLFEDGMIWRRQNSHKLLSAEEAGWTACSCGMKNPAEADRCAYCRRPIAGRRKENGELPLPFLLSDLKTLTETVAIPTPTPETADHREISAEPATEEAVPVQEPVVHMIEDPVQEDPVQEDPLLEEALILQDRFPAAEDPTANPGDLLEELEKLLFPFGGWTAQTENPEEEEFAIPAGEREETAEQLCDELVLERREEEPELPMDLMQQTGEILMELERRLRARENGESESPRVQQEQPPESEEEQEDVDKGSKSIGFWVFMILLMIVLALAGFFGVLYFKGYFGL